MTQKSVATEDVPDLNDWMAKIREKKLRPVIPNQHKSKEDITANKDRTAGPHEVNEILKMRQGLRSVSTPKWPGVNDNKAKTNVGTSILLRAQLRSVSDRATSESKAGHKQAVETLPEQDAKALPAEEIAALDQVDEGEFPLDAEPTKQMDVIDDTAPGQASQDLSVSSGTVDPEAKIDLKLPKLKQEDFPLDHEVTNVINGDDTPPAKGSEEPDAPVTLSTGVFETKDATVPLDLPPAKNNDFPLDAEAMNAHAQSNDAESTIPADLSASSGVIEPDPIALQLQPPPKAKTQQAVAETSSGDIGTKNGEDEPNTENA